MPYRPRARALRKNMRIMQIVLYIERFLRLMHSYLCVNRLYTIMAPLLIFTMCCVRAIPLHTLLFCETIIFYSYIINTALNCFHPLPTYALPQYSAMDRKPHNLSFHAHTHTPPGQFYTRKRCECAPL